MNTNRYRNFGYIPLKHVERSQVAMTRTVKTDQMTDMANECFDLPFDGQCKFYPFIMPDIPEYHTLVITGRSGSGKSTLLNALNRTNGRCFTFNDFIMKPFSKAGMTFDEFSKRIGCVGLNVDDLVFMQYGNLSEGEKFRADVALQLDNDTVFDEFTSMVDRTVAKTVCEGIRQYIDGHDLSGIVFCSCHKDFIEWIHPDVIIDLDDAMVYVPGDDNTTANDNIKEELIGSFKI